MKRNVLIAAFIPLVLIALLAAMCATTPPAPAKPAEEKTASKPAPAEKVYEGAGKDASMLNARSFAIMDAVRKGVIELIGAAVDVAAVDRVGIVGPAALNMHEVEKPRAIGILVEHADGKKVVRVRLPGIPRIQTALPAHARVPPSGKNRPMPK